MRESPSKDVERIIARIRGKMKPWGITATFLAGQLGVSRQYAWQIVHSRTPLSLERAHAIEKIVEEIIDERKHVQTFGERLKAARISAGLTLKQAAKKIGYSWVGVERWEKNICLPAQEVLWKLCSLYCVGESWFTEEGHFESVTSAGAPHSSFMRSGIREELVATLRAEMALPFTSRYGRRAGHAAAKIL